MAIPEKNPAVSDAGVGAAAHGVKSNALGALHLVQKPNFRSLEQIIRVPLNREGCPRRHVDLNRLEIGESGYGGVSERVDGAVDRQHHKQRGEYSEGRHNSEGLVYWDRE